MHIAIEGCAHGELDIIYNTINELEKRNKIKIDLLICCGDFQAVRNKNDLKCMAVPEKFMQMHDFHQYYSGNKKAPLLTIFIGGNHEASNYMQELPYGGWVAPNIYYLGYAAVVKYGSLRIGGLSGIYKGTDYLKGHFEKSPYTQSSVRSVYHVRNLETFRVKQLSGDIDILLSHDWPRGIYNHGNVKQLIQTKKYFEAEIASDTLGSRPCEDILKKLQPKYWFSGHLHVKFSAIVHHKDENEKPSKKTKFLALDKCLPRRNFLQILDIENERNPILQHDEEWLTILKLTNHLLSVGDQISYMPGPGYRGRYEFTPTKDEIEETVRQFGNLEISCNDFHSKSESHYNEDNIHDMRQVFMPKPKPNIQTEKFCSRLGIDDPMALLCGWKTKDKSETLQFSTAFNTSEMEVTIDSTSFCQETFNESMTPSPVESHDIIFDLDCTTDNDSEVKLVDVTSDFVLQKNSCQNENNGQMKKLSLNPVVHNTKILAIDSSTADQSEGNLLEISLDTPSLKRISPDDGKRKKFLRRNTTQCDNED